MSDMYIPKDRAPPPPKQHPYRQLNDVKESLLEENILQSKTLKRKNFKKLSLESSPAPPSNDFKETPKSIRPQTVKIRPAPLLKLNHKPINRNIDPENKSSTKNIINQLDDLNLNEKLKEKENYNIIKQNSNSTSANYQKQSVPVPLIHRKKQTIISSISPTKSSSSPTSNASPQQLNSPISTTLSIKLNNDDLVTLKNLGSGNSGTVSKILHIPTQKTMAKKIIHIDLKTVIQTQIIRELRILHECHSPYIIEFYGAFINNNNTIVICMEYCNCGSLDKILELSKPKHFPIHVLKKLSFAILNGLCYLYTNHKIIHRDIKPSNVLMTHKGDFKLCDFGVSRELTNSLAMADTFVGTSTYMSPERIQGLNYGIKSDIWSMGLMLIELATGKSIWADDSNDDDIPKGPEGILDLLQRIVNETPPSLKNKLNSNGEKFDDDLCNFVDSCLIKDDNLRKSPWDLLNDKNGFLKNVQSGYFDKDVKIWAKKIRKLHKNKYESGPDKK